MKTFYYRLTLRTEGSEKRSATRDFQSEFRTTGIVSATSEMAMSIETVVIIERSVVIENFAPRPFLASEIADQTATEQADKIARELSYNFFQLEEVEPDPEAEGVYRLKRLLDHRTYSGGR